jgi:catalase (peroxidase I)
MRAFSVVIGTALAAAALVAPPGHARSADSATEYSRGVSRICAGALLFDQAHHMGTRADALSVARDIRASTARRLARVTALSVPPELRRISSRWISSQRRLAASYAQTWVRIYDTIEAAGTPAQRATLPEQLERLVHASDPLRLAARRLELELHVPDCTGGG